ncbi:MAG: VWA domain-containing protein [Rhizobiaceae bacterium]|nr:VWA domain-containing protein [Rhizobiaceae bacterium]
MTDELKKLEDAFRSQSVSPRSEAKAEAFAAAMIAFEEEKISAASQGTLDGTRLNKQGGDTKPLSKWRRIMNGLNTKLSYGLMGSASVAVLALVVVGPNVSDLLDGGVGILPITQNETKSSEVRRTKEQTVPSNAVSEEVIGEAVPAEQSTLADSVLVPAKPLTQDIQHSTRLLSGLGEAQEAARVQKRAPSPQVKSSVGQSLQAESSAQFSSGRVSGDLIFPQYRDQGRDKFEEIETNPIKVVSEDPVSTFSVDVDTASYAFMRSSINNGVLPQKDAVRVEELINYFDYAYDVPEDRSEPFKANITIVPTPWNEGTKLMSIGIKGYELAREEAPPANLVFLIDTSGSMNDPNKLPLLRNSFKLLLSTLRPDDTVSIVTYAGNAGTALEPTKVSESSKILSALDNLNASGSTAGAEGIRQAYNLAESSFKADGINRVILATDGDFNVGISNPEELKGFVERKRKTGVTLSVLGFGRGNYNDALMQKLAQNGNGNAAYIDTLSEARKVLVEEAGSTLFPIAKDVKLQVEFNPALVSEYRLIGYETRALKREDFNNDKVDAGDIGAGHTVTALYEITPVGSSAQRIDDLRYGENATTLAADSSEYAFLKMRYKLPDSDISQLVTRPVTVADEVSSTVAASTDARFAVSVAAFGQMLRGGEYTGSYTYDDVIALAQSGKGDDEFGYRAEFINLVRLAKTAATLEPLE